MIRAVMLVALIAWSYGCRRHQSWGWELGLPQQRLAFISSARCAEVRGTVTSARGKLLEALHSLFEEGSEAGVQAHASVNPAHDGVYAYSERYWELQCGPLSLGFCAGAESGGGVPDAYSGPYIEWAGLGDNTCLGFEAGISTDGPFCGFYASLKKGCRVEGENVQVGRDDSGRSGAPLLSRTKWHWRRVS